MTVPPDDLPRSRTGRVPQWVLDEAAGRPVAPSTWRDADLAPRPHQGRTTRRVRPGLVVLLVATLVAGAGWFGYQRYPDQTKDLLADLRRDATGTTTVLPDPLDRDYPAPGREESDAPLDAPPTVAATSESFAFLHSQGTTDAPVTWSPCRPIHYVINLTGAPTGFAEHTALAIGEVSAATGLRFVFDGLVTETPDPDRAPYLPTRYGDQWAPVLIAFADPTQIVSLVTAAGVTTPQAMTDPTTGVLHFVTGVVDLDVELLAVPDDGTTPAYLPVLRHELGHLVGLDHINDATQLMYPFAGFVQTFQAGDLTGLADLGRGACAPGL